MYPTSHGSVGGHLDCGGHGDLGGRGGIGSHGGRGSRDFHGWIPTPPALSCAPSVNYPQGIPSPVASRPGYSTRSIVSHFHSLSSIRVDGWSSLT